MYLLSPLEELEAMNLHEQCLLRYLTYPDELSYTTEILKLNNKILEQKFVVKNIDWDEEDIWKDWEGDDFETETLQKAVNELPDSIEIEVSEEDVRYIVKCIVESL